MLAPDPDSPIFDARLVFPVGRAHDPADRPYLADAAAVLLELDEEGFHERRVLDKLAWALGRGTATGYDVASTSTTFRASGMALWADWHLWVLSWWLDQGTFNRSSLHAVHRNAARLAKDESSELDEVTRTLRSRLFGEGHAYAAPPPLVGTAFLRIEAVDLHRWKAERFRARGTTLVVSGNFKAVDMKREIGELFGPWDGGAVAPLPSVEPIRPEPGPHWLAVDEPKALQTRIFVGFATRSDADADEPARDVLAEMISDELRVVREGMGATYALDVEYESGAAGGALMIRRWSTRSAPPRWSSSSSPPSSACAGTPPRSARASYGRARRCWHRASRNRAAPPRSPTSSRSRRCGATAPTTPASSPPGSRD